jgi:hypothetical protein
VHGLLNKETPNMKTTLLAILVLAISTGAACADLALPSRLSLAPVPTGFASQSHATSHMLSEPTLTLGQVSGTSSLGAKLDPSSVNFAQIGAANQSMPLPSGLVLALVAVFVLALRIMGVNHARAMADHERDSYTGKARMFRSLHEGGADH